MLRILWLPGAAAWLSIANPAIAADLAADAKAFGARESIRSVEISPSGRQLLFIAAGPGRTSVLRTVDVATKRASTLLATSGDPEDLYWCAFGSDTQLVCKYGGYGRMDQLIVGSSRLITLSTNGGKPQPLGQRESYYNPVLRQYDGDILDWLPGEPGSVLMARTYRPSATGPAPTSRTRARGSASTGSSLRS
ncbi:MAG TPA: hypothetical protein VE403_03160 [Sphingomicrobium sp.]|nr:hypothetical protein [Sphingomicrobium sp.]